MSKSPNHSMSNKGVCRTVLATPGLLITLLHKSPKQCMHFPILGFCKIPSKFLFWTFVAFLACVARAVLQTPLLLFE